jgi:hypothetical protein
MKDAAELCRALIHSLVQSGNLVARVRRGLILRGLIVDFPAVAQQADREYSAFAVSLINDPVVAHAELEET